MGKQYTQVSNEARKELIRLIYEESFTIVKAAEATGIYYPTAKAINKVYKRENRVQKRAFRYRTKKEDEAAGVVRNKIPIEKLAINKNCNDTARLICGVRRIDKRASTIKKFKETCPSQDILAQSNSTASPLSSDSNESALSTKFQIPLLSKFVNRISSDSLECTTITEKSNRSNNENSSASSSALNA